MLPKLSTVSEVPALATDASLLQPVRLELDTLLLAYELMAQVQEMANVYDENRDIAKYVHSTSRGHEAIQLAVGMQLLAKDYAYPYYRDESILLGIGLSPYELMLQLLAKKDDPFSGGRTYYAHPSLRREGLPKIPHQSSATGMQAIPATGAAQGLKYLETHGLAPTDGPLPVVVCSLGDGSMTEGEVAEALQMAVLHQLPIVYLVQDNAWGISATGDEMRAMNAIEYAKGFKGLEAVQVDGADFIACYHAVFRVLDTVRKQRRPVLLYAPTPLLGHHTSGVRSEWYRKEPEFSEAKSRDPFPRLALQLQELGLDMALLTDLDRRARERVRQDFEKAKAAPEPTAQDLKTHIYAPTPILEEKGVRTPQGAEAVVMVDAALHAIDEIMREFPEALLYGQDVGARLGGVFREAATLAQKYGDSRVFNTPIQEAYIIGSTAGMSAVGCKPIVEVQFADYIWPGLNQLFTELSRSCYLTLGKWPVSSVIRVPIGAYGGGGPYHSSSIETVLLNIRGIKIAYPSNSADLKGLMKAAFYDPNPVVVLEHKGLYWSKVPGTKDAKTPEPDSDYVIPFGKARIHQAASEESVKYGESVGVVTYGMSVYWAQNASSELPGQVEILDLRTLEPIDWEAIETLAKRHGKLMVLTEEPLSNSFAEAIAGRIATRCFTFLDAPVMAVGAEDLPAIPLNITLEAAALPSAEKVAIKLRELSQY